MSALGAMITMLKATARLVGRWLCCRFDRMRTALRDDRKGWTICAAVLLVTVIRCGLTYSFGIIIVELEAEYHRSLVEQNWIGTLSFFVSQTLSPLSVSFIRSLSHNGYRVGALLGTGILVVSCAASSLIHDLEWMFFTHSFLYGVGSSLLYMASSLVIANHFDVDHEYHVMATSILLCGYPIGSLLFNPLNAWVVGEFGWRVSFRCMGVLILVCCLPCCWLFTQKDTPGIQRLVETDSEANSPTESEPPKAGPLGRLEAVRQFLTPSSGQLHNGMVTSRQAQKEAARNCLREIYRRPEIMLWYLGNCLSFICYYMPFVNLAFYMQRKGISPVDASWTLTMLSLAECITYIVASFLGDYLKGKLVYINIISEFCLGLICITWPFVDVDLTLIVIISMALGGCIGLTIVYNYAASVEVTQLPQDRAWAYTNMWTGLGVVLGPICSGAVYDWRHSYDDMFYVVGAVYAASALIFSAIPILQRYRHWKNKDSYDELNGARNGSLRGTPNLWNPEQPIKCPEGGDTDTQSTPDEVEKIGLSQYSRSYNATERR